MLWYNSPAIVADWNRMQRGISKVPKIIASVLALAFTAALVIVPSGCGQKTEKPVKTVPTSKSGYPIVEEFKDVGSASKAAGFQIRTPGDAMGAKLDHVTVVKVTADRRYVDLFYDREVTISETPGDKSSNYQTALAEHQDYINKLPTRLQTYEKPESVEIAGHKGILWMHKGDVIVEKRPLTGVQSFHMPYLVWWDDGLEYRLSIDDPKIFEPDPAAGTKELEKI